MLRTADMFLSAYLISNNVKLDDVTQEDNRVIFIFPSNSRSEELFKLFRIGRAKSNVLELKKNYQHLQDLLHESKRTYKF